MSDNAYDNIESWQYRWAKWARYAHITPSEIAEDTYKDGHSTESYNGMSYLVTMQHIALMRRLGKEPSNIVLPDNSSMLAKLAELSFAVRDDDRIGCTADTLERDLERTRPQCPTLSSLSGTLWERPRRRRASRPTLRSRLNEVDDPGWRSLRDAGAYGFTDAEDGECRGEAGLPRWTRWQVSFPLYNG
jgi:hypothetical protein